MATLTTRPTLASFIDEVGGRVACLALSRDPNAKLTILVFPPGTERPSHVAKVPTTEAAARSVEREAAKLTELARRDLGAASMTVPKVITHLEHLGRPVLVMTALPGRSMLADYHAWRHTARRASVAADLAAAGAWLSGLHRQTGSGSCRMEVALEGVAGAISDRFGTRHGIDADLASLESLRHRLAGLSVPMTVVHGDFWPGNLLVSKGEVIGVIDWEMARLDGPATCDLAHFAITYSLYLDRHTRPGHQVPGHPGLRAGQWGSGLDYMMSGTGWYPGLVRAFVRAGLERLGVPGDCWRDVLLADLAITAAQADHGEFAWNHLLAFRRLQERS